MTQRPLRAMRSNAIKRPRHSLHSPKKAIKYVHRRAFSVSVFARHDNRVLLINHRRLGTWLPIGGELDPAETPLEAARRELLEETGLEGTFVAPGLVEGTPSGFLCYEEHLAGSKGLHMNFVFVADVGTDAVVPNEEFSEFCWVHDPETVPCPSNVKTLARLALQAGSST